MSFYNALKSFVKTVNDAYTEWSCVIREWDYLSQSLFFSMLLVGAYFLLTLMIKFVVHMREVRERGRRMGRRPVHEIHDTFELLKEIHFAACHCDTDVRLVERCVALLMRFPAACNLPLPGGHYTPFLRACYGGNTELISYMLHNGAEVNAKDPVLGDHPFYLVTYSILSGRCASYEPLSQLISAGADVNATRAGGYTALHCAASRGDSRLVRWLLSHGADVAPSTARRTPYQLALDRGHLGTAALLHVTADEEQSCEYTPGELRLILQ